MKLHVLIFGYGAMGHAIEYLLSARHDVRIWNMGVVVRNIVTTPTTLNERVADYLKQLQTS